MATDLILGSTNTNWSRGESLPESASGHNGHWQFIRGEISDEVTLQLTESEKAMLQKLVVTKSRAKAGDEAAKKKLARMIDDVAALKVAARKGDARAKRRLLVLRESGVFNKTKKLDVSGSLFADDPHAKDRRAERYEAEINKITSPEQIEDLARIVAHNPEYKDHTRNLVARGNTTARKILDASEKYAAGTTSRIDLPKTILRGSQTRGSQTRGDMLDLRTPASEIHRRVANMKADLLKLRQKKPRTDEDRRTMDALEEHIARSEAVSGESSSGESSFIGRHHRRRDKTSRQQRLANLKTRAAAGDQAAVAKLQAIQTKLTTELSTLSTPATATTTAPPVIPGTTIPPAVPGAPPVINPTTYPTTTPTTAPTTYPATYPPGYPYPQGYPTYQPQYAYQSPYYDPSTMDPYGPAPQPTVDVYQGDSDLGEEEAALAREAGGAERAALIRSGRASRSQGAFVSGLAIPNPVYRATIQKYARRHADGENPTTKDIFLAKAAVDRAIGKAGITLYMPGAQPGRRTI